MTKLGFIQIATPFNEHKHALFDEVTTKSVTTATQITNIFFSKIKGRLQPPQPPSGSGSGYSNMFDITRGTRQGSKHSPYLFNIFINQLLLDLNDCDVGVQIGDVLYNSMAYADDITVFSTNAKYLKRLIDMCTMYSE